MDTRLSLSLLSACFGLVMGCYFNTLSYRVRSEKRLWTEHCICPTCGHTLALWEQIPLFGYLILGGRCRYCRASIGVQYPLIEGGYALLWGAVSIMTFPYAPLTVLICCLFETVHLLCALVWDRARPKGGPLPKRKLLFAVATVFGYGLLILLGLGIMTIGLTA